MACFGWPCGRDRMRRSSSLPTKQSAAFPTSLTLEVVSWNVANSEPSELTPLLGPPGGATADILLIGAQEASYDSEADAELLDVVGPRRRSFRQHKLRHSKKFSVRVMVHLGDGYHLCALHSLGEIVLLVAVRRRYAGYIHNVEVDAVATGFAGVMANKGGVSVFFDLGAVRIGAFCAHLHAHQGESFRARRNEDVQGIVHGPLGRSADVAVGNAQAAYTFFFGDLNYRVDLPRHESFRSLSHESQVAHVKQLVGAGDFAVLLEHDGLSRERADGRCLLGFEEAPIAFPPTFKVLREPGLHYDEQRVPSWCDRVLWTAAPTHRDTIRCTSYESVPALASSDHKPVRASFHIAFPRRPIHSASQMLGVGRRREIPAGIPAGSQRRRPRRWVVDHVNLSLDSLAVRFATKAQAEDAGAEFDGHLFSRVRCCAFSFEAFGSHRAFTSSSRRPREHAWELPKPLRMRCRWRDRDVVEDACLLLRITTDKGKFLGQILVSLRPDADSDTITIDGPLESQLVQIGTVEGTLRYLPQRSISIIPGMKPASARPSLSIPTSPPLYQSSSV